MNGFELHVSKGRFHNRIGGLMEVPLEICEAGIQLCWWGRYEGCVSRSSATNPVLGAAEFSGLLLSTTSLREEGAK
jgi:hypothetical protein